MTPQTIRTSPGIDLAAIAVFDNFQFAVAEVEFAYFGFDTKKGISW